MRHDGRPFTEADVRGVCGVGQSAKSGDLTTIGRFGIGFKSVYAYTTSPRIYSGAERFRIESYVRPFPVAAADVPAAETLFVFPFDHDDVPAPAAVAEISAALTGLEPRTLLFLRSIERIGVRGVGTPEQVLRRVASARSGASRHVTLAKRGERDRADEQWLVWHRTLDALGQPDLRAEIALRASPETGETRLVTSGTSPLVVFFPTQKETFLGFVIQGPYRTTPARDNVPEDDPWNLGLVRETAVLLTGMLRELRDEGLLTADVLQAMPLDAARFEPGTMFRALFDAGRAVLSEEQLIPVAGGGYGAAAEVKLTRSAGLRELLTPGLLGELYGAGQRVAFTDEAITDSGTPLLWRYLRAEAGVGEVTPESLVARLTGEFLAARPDDWIARFYAFLQHHHALWAEPGDQDEPPGPARLKPVIRLEDGSQVAAFDAAGRPAAYLPGPLATGLPTVRRAVASVPGARQFLEALRFTEPDVIAEVMESVLPRYDGLDVTDLDAARHEADLERVARALDEAPACRRDELLDRLQRTTFLVAENAAAGEQQLMTPPGVYQRTKDLEIYFDGNPDAWFAADTYGPWRAQLRGMGVREEVGLRVRRADLSGFVVTAAEFARHERGLDGFDPGAQFDGLDFALAHPDHARSEYIWNALLVPGRKLVAGVVEKATRQGYQDGRREHVLSVAGTAATAAAWLPGPDGTFRRPDELQVDELPPTYIRDEGLARALGMGQAAVEEASRQLGIPPAVLRGLSERPDLVAMIERELENRRGP